MPGDPIVRFTTTTVASFLLVVVVSCNAFVLHPQHAATAGYHRNSRQSLDCITITRWSPLHQHAVMINSQRYGIGTNNDDSFRSNTVAMYGVINYFRNRFGRKVEEGSGEGGDQQSVDNAKGRKKTAEKNKSKGNVGRRTAFFRKTKPEYEDVSICIIGGGVSGLTAAITAATEQNNKTLQKRKSQTTRIIPTNETNDDNNSDKILLLESTLTLGGRVQSDHTPDNFTLDRGFAVFIEEYPQSKKLLDYDALKLGRFVPGALIKTKDPQRLLLRVVDPLRQPDDVFFALFEPVGTLIDKFRLVSLVVNVLTKTVEEIFQEKESDTLTCLTERYGFSEKFIEEFFEPFLEGIYLAPLKEQSSRMFHFVMKMFAEGAASLPLGGMGAVANQLVQKAEKLGVDVRVEQHVQRLAVGGDEDGDFFVVNVANAEKIIRAKCVIIATDGQMAQKIMSGVDGFESLEILPEQPQRSVGCLYYGFESEAPVTEPILILNGMGEKRRGTAEFPVNNVCFPSVVNEGYAPKGRGLCSVTILKGAMDHYRGKTEELDAAVRKQLATWFPDYAEDIREKWELKRIYDIQNAQPAHFGGPFPANINGGRDCDAFRGKRLPKGLLICGDHMATATLNGALESGVNAGNAAVKLAI